MARDPDLDVGEVPYADRLEQSAELDPDDEAPDEEMTVSADQEAAEADIAEQLRDVPTDEDDYRQD